MRLGRTFSIVAVLSASVCAQAVFECYTPGPFRLPGPNACEAVLCNNLGFNTGIRNNLSCGMPSEGSQYARLDCNGPFSVPAGGPPSYPLPTNVTELRVAIPAGATTISFCWEYFNAEGVGSSFNDGTAISIVSSAGTLVQLLAYADNQMATGSCQDTLSFATEVSPNGLQPFSGPLPALSGGEYLSVAVWNGGDNVAAGCAMIDNVQFGAPGQVCPPPPPPLANDTCATAVFITEGSITPGTNITASTGPDPVGACGGMSEDVWYVFVASCSGTYTASTCDPGTNYDTVLAVWDGSGGCGGLSSLACNDDNCSGANFLASTLTFTATAGSTYYVSVGGFFGSNGNFNLFVNAGGGMQLSFFSGGPGSLGYNVTGGPSNGSAFTAITPNQGAYPNDWFFGIGITLQDIASEYGQGFPFVVGLDGCGSATVGPFGGLPSGLTVYGVSLGIPNGGNFPTVNSPPASGTVP